MFWRKRVRVEHTGDGVTRRPTVLKTVAVTGLHALPQLTIYSSSIGVVHVLACSIQAGEIEVFQHASLLAFGIRKGKEQGRVLPQRLKPLSFAMLFARLKPCASTSGFPRRAFRGGLSAAVHAARAFSSCGFRGWLYPVLPRRASKRPRRTGQHATGDAAVCVLGNQGGFEC